MDRQAFVWKWQAISVTQAARTAEKIDLTRLPPVTPPRIVELQCLDRDVTTRFRDIGEARVAFVPLTERFGIRFRAGI